MKIQILLKCSVKKPYIIYRDKFNKNSILTGAAQGPNDDGIRVIPNDLAAQQENEDRQAQGGIVEAIGPANSLPFYLPKTIGSQNFSYDADVNFLDQRFQLLPSYNDPWNIQGRIANGWAYRSAIS